MFWREAISPLHVPVGVRCSGEIASPDCHQARNDVVGLQARNDAPFRHCESLFSRHCESLSSRHCEERSDEAISSNAPPRNCEPKGWQVCWREAISSLHVLVGVRCSEGIASPDCYQARNDAMGLFARNDAPFRHCESLSSRHCEERSDEAISHSSSVIANRRVGKCAVVKQSPHCTFLLVLGVLGGLLCLIVIRLAMTQWGCSLAMTGRWLAMAISVK